MEAWGSGGETGRTSILSKIKKKLHPRKKASFPEKNHFPKQKHVP